MSQQIGTKLAGMPRCGVCTDEFQASGPKKPKVLPCRHTFCRECLRNMETDGRIECPLCRGICQKAIEELPNDVLRLKLDGLDGTSSPPNASDEPTSPTPAVDDMISALRTCYEEPDKVLPQLKVFRHVRKTAHFQAEHIMMVMICMEHYAQNPLQQPDIIIVCIQIVHDMVSCGLTSDMSAAVQEKLLDDIFEVLTVSNTIRTGLRYPCVDILFHLCMDETEKNFSCANTKVLFEFMDESMQSEEDAKLIVVLLSLLRTADVVVKEDIGTMDNVKIVLKSISANSAMDSYLDILISVLITLTDMTTLPCKNIVAEGGLNITKRLLEEQTHRHDVIASVMILLSNISEIPDLRKDIITNTSLVEIVVSLLHSESAEVSILSALNISDLSLHEASEWLELCGNDNIRTMALSMLGDIVAIWVAEDPLPDAMPFSTNSFKTFFSLLELHSAPPCQLYAAWILRKCCTEERYQELLIKEDGISILFAIKENDLADETLRKVVEDILLSVS